jgi:oligopeptide transport system ATP-binding protein
MRQRAMIAMALSCNPKLLIADEPTTALDVTIQAQIMDLLGELKTKINTAIILITHDLGVVAGSADRVAVMYAGKVVETGTTDDIFYRNAHPYTQALLRSLPSPDTTKQEELTAIPGTPPDLLAPPAGCGFAARCEHCMKICQEEQPPEFTLGEGHSASCWLLHPDCPSAEERGDK